MGILIQIVIAIFTALMALYAGWQVKRASLKSLFGNFDQANRATFEYPELLYSVHGLPRSVDIEEARRIAYLSMLLDGFQHFYGNELKWTDFEKKLKAQSVFLNRILAVPDNRTRWEYLKKMYYGDFDKEFIQAVDNLFDYEEKKADRAPSAPNPAPKFSADEGHHLVSH